MEGLDGADLLPKVGVAGLLPRDRDLVDAVLGHAASRGSLALGRRFAEIGEVVSGLRVESSGFVVQGALEVTINNQCNSLEAGDGFFIDALSPYRFTNHSDQKAIVVLNDSSAVK